MSITGVDVSRHQGSIDWSAVAASGIAFAVCKATEGTTWVDPMFDRNASGARAAGLPVGAYHFARPGSAGVDDAHREAAHFLSVAGGRVDWFALDLEDDQVPAGRKLGAWAQAWLERVSPAISSRLWLYSYRPYWLEHGDASEHWRRFVWWLADYSPPPASVAPWGPPTIWQRTSSGSVPGIAGRCDLNRYEGTVDDFRALVGLTPAPPPPLDPPTSYPGDHMQRIPVRVTTDGNGRGYSDLAIDRARVVSILLGGDEPSDGWGPYVGAPAYAIAVAGKTRVVVPESPIITGTVDLVVWAADA